MRTQRDLFIQHIIVITLFTLYILFIIMLGMLIYTPAHPLHITKTHIKMAYGELLTPHKLGLKNDPSLLIDAPNYNATKLGQQHVKAIISDLYGNKETKMLTITIADQIPPVLKTQDTLVANAISDDHIRYAYNQPFDIHQVFQAMDGKDGDVSTSLHYEGEVDTSKMGDYPITVYAFDHHHNQTKRQVTISIAHITPPTLTQKKAIDLDYEASFHVEDYFEAKDVNRRQARLEASDVDTSIPGDRQVVVRAIDDENNVASMQVGYHVKMYVYHGQKLTSGNNVQDKGQTMTKGKGVNDGPSGKETWYNLPMDGVIRIMRQQGNHDAYWVRSDGVKMLGQYVMVAANLDIHPRGSLVKTSLGLGIVCDTGTFALDNPNQLDIATSW